MDEKKAPDLIYLQWDDEDIWDDEGVTWCVNSINATDVIYIRHDVHLVKNKELRDALEEIKQKYIDGCMPADAMYQIAVEATKDDE